MVTRLGHPKPQRYDLSQVSDQLILHDIRTRNTKLMNDIFMLLAIDAMQILITSSLMTHSPKELFMFYHCVFAFFYACNKFVLIY